jgi:hypothetical protein
MSSTGPGGSKGGYFAIAHSCFDIATHESYKYPGPVYTQIEPTQAQENHLCGNMCLETPMTNHDDTMFAYLYISTHLHVS